MSTTEVPLKLQRFTTDSNGCWLWNGYIKAEGYASITYEGRTRNAHRLMYTLLVGDVPEGLELDHLCRVRHCVNPAHLEPVTRRENQARGLSIPGQRARQTHCQHGHLFDSANTRVSKRGHRSCRACDAAQKRAERAALSAERKSLQ